MRVLLATDGSASAQRACQLVGSIDWPPDSTFRIVTALPHRIDLFGYGTPVPTTVRDDEAEASLISEVSRDLELIADQLARPGRSIKTAVLRGSAGQAIVDEADRFDPDLVAIGSRGHGAIASMLLGSVADEVVDRVHRPVLVARGARLHRIVLGTDGTPAANAAVDVVARWPIFADTKTLVVTVADVDFPWWSGMGDPDGSGMQRFYTDASEAARTQSIAACQAAADTLRAAGRIAQRVACSGDAANELVAEASGFDADLIVVGSRCITGLKRVWLGSVARNVVHHAPCSVLIVPAPVDGADARTHVADVVGATR